ncbi:flagellar hook-length control protein FliK [Nitrobacter sp. NHB1]|uniref:flagellar hook-length control protein FliK n=1 Tax=Nitrobacter sp. NHB1 TaxID=3119830 RepID=UPI003000168D
MAISINPIFPVIAAQGAASDAALQPGSVIDARVQKILANDLVRIAIANLTIEVLSEIPLQVGQSLQLAVSQTAQGLKLSVVGQSGSPNLAAAAAAATAEPTDTVTLTADGAATVAAAKADALAPPSKSALTALEALFVSAAAQSAATRQGSLSPLYANLLVAAGSGKLPPQAQQVVDRLLSLRPDLGPNLAGSDIKTAFRNSGLFLEVSLAAGLKGAPSAAPASAPAQLPDLKAALLVLREALSITAGAPVTQSASGAQQAPQPAAGPAPSMTGAPPLSPDFEPQEAYLPQARLPVTDDPDNPAAMNQTLFSRVSDAGVRAAATGAALNRLQEVLQNGGSRTGFGVELGLDGDPAAGPSPLRAAAANGPTENNVFIVRTSTPSPPFRDALPSAQPVALPLLASGAPASEIARHLLDDTDAAIARQTLLQVASLPDRVDTAGVRSDQLAPRWNFEIPFATPMGTAIAQFEIARDAAAHDVETAKRVWRARFSLDVEPTGPVHALVSLTGDNTSVRLWAERPATVSRLRAGASQLSQALSRAELQPGDIVISEGVPPQQRPAPAGHFLDRAL